MPKILDATCSPLGIVTAEGVVVPDCVVLSEGKQASEGVMIMDQDKATYLTSSASDIEATLTSVIAALTEIASTLTAIGAGMTGPTTAPPGTLPASVVTITAKVTELTALKAALK
jgi:hypothetical protein